MKIAKKLLKETKKPKRASISVLRNVVMGDEFNNYLKLIADVGNNVNIIDVVTPLNISAIRSDWLKTQDFHPVFSYKETEMRKLIIDIDDVDKFLWPSVEYKDDIRRLLAQMAESRARDIGATAELAESILKREPHWGNQILQEKYGDVSDDLIIEAATRVDEFVDNKGTPQKTSALLSQEEQDALYLMSFDAEAIKYWLEWSLDRYGFDIPVQITDDAETINVSIKEGGYVVNIPQREELNGVQLLETNIHEIESHILDAMNTKALLTPFGTKQGIGPIDNDLLSEGHAKLQEVKFHQKYFGEIVEPAPWYIFAMDAALDGKGFLKTAQRLSDYLSVVYGERAAALAWKYTYRIFRGSQNTFPCRDDEEPFVFSKDKVYLEGYLLAKELEENNLGHWLHLGGLKPKELIAIAKVVDFQPEDVPYPLKDTTDAMLKLFLSDAADASSRN